MNTYWFEDVFKNCLIFGIYFTMTLSIILLLVSMSMLPEICYRQGKLHPSHCISRNNSSTHKNALMSCKSLVFHQSSVNCQLNIYTIFIAPYDIILPTIFLLIFSIFSLRRKTSVSYNLYRDFYGTADKFSFIKLIIFPYQWNYLFFWHLTNMKHSLLCRNSLERDIFIFKHCRLTDPRI